MEAEKFECKFVRASFVTRWPCAVCGGRTEKVFVLTEYASPPHGEAAFRICEQCLKGDIDERLKKQADTLEGMAQLLRSLVGRLKVPTYEEWEAEEQRANDEFAADLTD